MLGVERTSSRSPSKSASDPGRVTPEADSAVKHPVGAELSVKMPTDGNARLEADILAQHPSPRKNKRSCFSQFVVG